MVTQRNHNYDKLDVSGTCKSLYRKLYFQQQFGRYFAINVQNADRANS